MGTLSRQIRIRHTFLSLPTKKRNGEVRAGENHCPKGSSRECWTRSHAIRQTYTTQTEMITRIAMSVESSTKVLMKLAEISP